MDFSARCFNASKLATAAAALMLMVAFSLSVRADNGTPPVLPSPLCDGVQIPDGNTFKFHVYATGVQIYQWNGSSWVFLAPSATLFADPGYHGQVGIHYAGPTWESKSGSKVLGMRLAPCTPDPTAIPWLRLGAIASKGPGVFDGVTFIQRVNTVQGKAPAPLPADTPAGPVANVPYTAEYFFYAATD